METATGHALAGLSVGHLLIAASALVVQPTRPARLPAALEVRSRFTLPRPPRAAASSPETACRGLSMEIPVALLAVAGPVLAVPVGSVLVAASGFALRLTLAAMRTAASEVGGVLALVLRLHPRRAGPPSRETAR